MMMMMLIWNRDGASFMLIGMFAISSNYLSAINYRRNYQKDSLRRGNNFVQFVIPN